jgi:hypothetical protein
MLLASASSSRCHSDNYNPAVFCYLCRAVCHLNCRRMWGDSKFNAASLSVLRSVTTLLQLDLEQHTPRMNAKEQARLEPCQELKAAVADLQQHNPSLKVG